LDGDSGTVPSAAFTNERKWAAFEEGYSDVGRAQDIDVAISSARGLRGDHGGQGRRDSQQVAPG
jgi:hypothetical protein